MAIPADIRAAILKRAVQLFIVVLIMAASLFLSAGRLDWWNGWLLLGLYVIQMVCTGAVLIRKDPEPIAERASYKKGAKSWDKVLAGMMGLYGPMAIWITAGLDTRNHWSDRNSPSVEVVGVALMVAGSFLVSWSMFSNRFFAPLVRIQ